MPTPINLDELTDFSAQALKKHKSKLVNISKMQITDIQVDTYGTTTLTLEDLNNAERTLTFEWDNRVSEKYLNKDLITTVRELRSCNCYATNIILGWV